MGMFDWLFGGPTHPVPGKPFAAIPYARWEATGPEGKAWLVRFAFTVRPERLEDFGLVSSAVVDLCAAVEAGATPVARRVRKYLESTPRYSDTDCLEVPAEIVGTTGIWVRASKLPWADVPVDMRERWPGAILLRFGKRPRDVHTVERVAGSPAKRADQRIARLRRRGALPVLAVLVQANAALFEPDGQDELPCMVVFSHDDSVTAGELSEIARLIFSVKGEPQSDPDLQALSDLVTNEQAAMYRRRPIPMRFTDGRVVFAADLWVTRAFLPDGYLNQRELICLAEPTDRGGLELLPQQRAGED
jgi:hypothetical protein